MGIGQWALGNGHARIKKAAVSNARSNMILSMPHAHLDDAPLGRCPIPHYQIKKVILADL
jgi:hypothetical protein